MSKTLVIQSHRQPLPYAWLQTCLDSVAGWADANGYAYRYIGDELFTLVAPELLEKTAAQPVIASDLARLLWCRRLLDDAWTAVVWCDADFLIFDAAEFKLPDSAFALGREVWVQADAAGKLRSYIKVHNAFMLFRRGNPFLEFYADTAQRFLRLNQGSMPPQFIGPKLLTALHNVAQCPVMESAGMLSPPVIRDLLAGGGPALNRFVAESKVIPVAANLSASLVANEGFSENQMSTLTGLLLKQGIPTASA